MGRKVTLIVQLAAGASSAGHADVTENWVEWLPDTDVATVPAPVPVFVTVTTSAALVLSTD